MKRQERSRSKVIIQLLCLYYVFVLFFCCGCLFVFAFVCSLAFFDLFPYVWLGHYRDEEKMGKPGGEQNWDA